MRGLGARTFGRSSSGTFELSSSLALPESGAEDPGSAFASASSRRVRPFFLVCRASGESPPRLARCILRAVAKHNWQPFFNSDISTNRQRRADSGANCSRLPCARPQRCSRSSSSFSAPSSACAPTTATTSTTRWMRSMPAGASASVPAMASPSRPATAASPPRCVGRAARRHRTAAVLIFASGLRRHLPVPVDPHRPRQCR